MEPAKSVIRSGPSPRIQFTVLYNNETCIAQPEEVLSREGTIDTAVTTKRQFHITISSQYSMIMIVADYLRQMSDPLAL